jgi:shikimate dehydrogenase
MKTVNDNKRSLNYCLIGEKLGHSYSREIHNLQGLSYDLIEVQETDLENFLNTTEYNNFNVTIPYKKAVLEKMDSLTPIAQLAGAVNTVKKVNGKYYGHNTDVDGMAYMVARKGVSLTGKNVMVLGSGGTSNTAVTLCKRENAKSVLVVSRSGEINYQNCYDYSSVEVIINTTPVGMFPNVEGSPINLANFKNLIAVFDCVYNPFLTDILSQASSLNITYSGGISMLVKQAVLAEEFWLDKTCSNEVVESLISKMVIDKSNVVLYGMPSAGKTTLGKIIAEKLNREFIDTDYYIEKTYGETPSKIITQKGIEKFREIESKAVCEVAKLSGKVIALGGGAVLDKSNVFALRRNGVLIYVKRDLNLLTTDNRPISKLVGVENLYNERKDIYDSVKDFEVYNNGEIESAVKEIINGYENTCNKRS